MKRAWIPIPKRRVGLVLRHAATEQSRWVGPPHRHDELEFNLVERGEATVLLDRRRYRLAPGDLLWLFAEQAHLLIEASADFEMWVGVFKPALVARQFGRSHVLSYRQPVGHYHRRLGAGDRRRLSAHLAALGDDQLTTPQINAGLGWLLVDAWRSFQAAETSKLADQPAVHPCVESAARRLSAEPGRWNLDSLARADRVSPAWLSRLFHRQLGLTLTDYRNRQRLRRLADLCRAHADHELTRLAFEAGFRSYSQCYRVCRRLVGLTPSSLRRGIEAGRPITL